jgi:hypothetical protein
MSFNFKKVAQDIAKGLMQLNPVTMKRYTPADLKALLSHLGRVERETRATQIPQEEILKTKRKNQHLQRIHHAITMVNSYVKKRRLRL